MSQPLPPNFNAWEPEEIKPPTRRKLRPGAKAALLSLLTVLAATVFLFGGLFRIRTIEVKGNRLFSADDVIREAGLHYGDGSFSVNENRVKDALEENHYLQFVAMEKRMPGTLILTVRERQAQVNVHVQGHTYLMDEEGMVLEESTEGLVASLPLVTGVQARSAMVGKMIVPGNEDQLTVFQMLMDELIQQGYLKDVAELKVSDPESLYMLTRDGYTIHLGDGEQLRAKIGTARAVVAKLKEMNHQGGVIDASVPAVATYIPSDL